SCLRVPLIGSIAAHIIDSVSVDNKGGKAGGSGSEAIAARLRCMGWKGNPLLLFPEGTTSNGSCLLRFKTGVFAVGVPVHPVTVKFEVGRFSPAFESIYAPVHILRALAEPVSRLSVEYLPRFDPTPEQRADRTLYAKAVQKVFCDAMDLPAVEAGYAQKTQFHIYLRRE
ncbi:unnamed protein product, partial [Hapterophycus canaliculatus]